jgi:hypothetical protein
MQALVKATAMQALAELGYKGSTEIVEDEA